MANGNGGGSPSGTPPPTQPDYRGANPVAYRIDPDGTLRKGSDPLPAGSIFASSAIPVAQVQPQWFNAPPFFVKRNKPAAFCKVGMVQSKPLQPLSRQLSWSITYSLLTAPNQDVASQSFTLPSQDADKLSNIPLPGGSGVLTCSAYAYVGGEPGKLFSIISDTLKRLQAIAGSTSSQAFFTISAADLTAAQQAESLFLQVVQGFEAPQESQYWMNTNAIRVVTTAGAAALGASALRLAYGVNTVILAPAQSNPKDHPDGQPDKAIDYFQQLTPYVGGAQKFSLDPDGVHTPPGGVNPFDAMPYVALTIEVDNSTS